ncbi:trf-like 8 [Anaeramoeba flamelloides]|uniref:Trf-like 8 n=1 Tax=Anaeramoeba flamelloides TaxID=1746091 RepID=A0ABQ8XK68_9EUKA|nr:trf-like 8 [Anaeramoeba flamelloides]
MNFQKQLTNSEKNNNLMFELHPYFIQKTHKEQEACLSLMSLGFQQQQQQRQRQQPQQMGFQSPPSSPVFFQNVEQFLNEENLHYSETIIRKRVHLEMSSEMSETSESETFENSLKQKSRTKTNTKTNTKKNTFKRTSRNKLVSHKRIVLKLRNKTKSTIKTTTRRKHKGSNRHETRPKAFAHQRVFWSNEECCCLIDGITRFGVGKWAKIMKQSEYTFHAKRTPHDLKDKWRNLTKFEKMQNIKTKYNYKQWLEKKQLGQQLN